MHHRHEARPTGRVDQCQGLPYSASLGTGLPKINNCAFLSLLILRFKKATSPLSCPELHALQYHDDSPASRTWKDRSSPSMTALAARVAAAAASCALLSSASSSADSPLAGRKSTCGHQGNTKYDHSGMPTPAQHASTVSSSIKSSTLWPPLCSLPMDLVHR